MLIRDNLRKRFWKEYNIGIIIIQLAMVFSLLVFFHSFDYRYMPAKYIVNFTSDTIIILISAIMYFGSMQSSMLDATTVSFMSIIAVNSFYAYLDAFGWMVNGYKEHRLLNYIVNFLYYLCGIVMIWLYSRFIKAHLKKPKKTDFNFDRLVNFLAAFSVLLLVGNIFGDYYFTVGISGYYLKTPNTNTISLFGPSIIMIVLVIYILIQRVDWKQKALLVIYPLLPFLSVVISTSSYGPTFNSLMLFLALVVLFNNFYIRREQELSQKEKQLAESKINSMILQINPHFIYNTLGSVSSLCIDNPEKARDLLFDFSSYLRNNFGEMAKKALIPFDKEIEHLRSYIAIEKQRFPDIEVVMNLEVTGFMIPSLSVQPLVENAITHGIMGREVGGKVTINSYEDEKYYYVSVEDDGVGFDTKKRTDDGRNHIGIGNVSDRLKMLVDGDLSINSTLDIGTVAVIRIPK